MLSPTAIIVEVFLVPLAVLIIYHDVRYRRIPNAFVLATLISGLTLNLVDGRFAGWSKQHRWMRARLYLDVHVARFRSDGRRRRQTVRRYRLSTRRSTRASDFCIVVLTGGVLALVSVVRSGVFTTTMHRVLQILVGLLPGWQMPKFSVPADRRLTIPYGVAITIGAIIATAIFHA